LEEAKDAASVVPVASIRLRVKWVMCVLPIAASALVAGV
jgi:hypothetical protein